MIFEVLHPVDGKLNTRFENPMCDYEIVALVEADSLEECYMLTQNDYNPHYAQLQRRSSCVGDIVTDPEGKHHMVMGTGFVELPHLQSVYLDL